MYKNKVKLPQKTAIVSFFFFFFFCTLPTTSGWNKLYLGRVITETFNSEHKWSRHQMMTPSTHLTGFTFNAEGKIIFMLFFYWFLRLNFDTTDPFRVTDLLTPRNPIYAHVWYANHAHRYVLLTVTLTLLFSTLQKIPSLFSSIFLRVSFIGKMADNWGAFTLCYRDDDLTNTS